MKRLRRQMGIWHLGIEKPFKHWHTPHYFIASVGMALVTVALLYYVVLTRPQPIPPPPLHITNFRIDAKSMDTNGKPVLGAPTLCGGNTYYISWQFTVDRPVAVAIHRTVLDQYGHTVPGSETTPLYRVYPWVRTIVERSSFTPPFLPPGAYVRAYAFVALDQPSQPEIYTLPFIIGKNCNP